MWLSHAVSRPEVGALDPRCRNGMSRSVFHQPVSGVKGPSRCHAGGTDLLRGRGFFTPASKAFIHLTVAESDVLHRDPSMLGVFVATMLCSGRDLLISHHVSRMDTQSRPLKC